MANRWKLQQMIASLEKIEAECLPESDRVGAKTGAPENAEKLDAFSLAKKNLTALLRELEAGIKEREQVIKEQGRGTRAIELRSANQKVLDQTKTEYASLVKIIKKETERAEKKKSKYGEEEIKAMNELVELFDAKIKELEDLHNGRKSVDKPSTVARDFKARRDAEKAKASAEGKTDDSKVEPVALSETTTAFLAEKEAYDVEFENQLDVIYKSLVRVRGIAEDIGDEVDKQLLMLDDAEKQMDKVNEMLKASNKRLKKLVAETGGSSRWCYLLVTFVILLALCGYIYTIVT